MWLLIADTPCIILCTQAPVQAELLPAGSTAAASTPGYNTSPSITSVFSNPHYGLGVPFYVHVTSPIRRYTDCLVHQNIKHHIAGKVRVCACVCVLMLMRVYLLIVVLFIFVFYFCLFLHALDTYFDGCMRGHTQHCAFLHSSCLICLRPYFLFFVSASVLFVFCFCFNYSLAAGAV